MFVGIDQVPPLADPPVAPLSPASGGTPSAERLVTGPGDLVCQQAFLLRRHGPTMGGHGQLVLLLARNAVLAPQVFGGFVMPPGTG